ncbi:cysteine desulfurase family protein [Formosa sp. A9]|uniref:cysteine desulfurase family protein n=1 Tax=Formosa sp. A9 TaxID=3442641 RepID=UPI003EBAE197
MKKVYLDHAATTPMRAEVIDKMSDTMCQVYGNPSSSHSFGRVAKSLVESARKTIAKLLNVTAAELVFTSGGTEANNLVLISAVRDLGVQRIISSRIEHHAVLHTIDYLKDSFNIEVDYVDLNANGQVDFQHLESLLKASDVKTLVSLMHINNEVGTILDLRKTGQLCKTYNALFHSDTVQSVGHYDLDLQNLSVDFISVSAHKFHGPKGVGVLYAKKQSGLKAIIHGGEQERGLRAGTEAVHNIVGFEEAIKQAYANLDTDKKYISELKLYFVNQLQQTIPQVKFNAESDGLDAAYTIVNIALPLPAEKASIILFQLDLNGIACSRGSACQSGSQKGSHVLEHILSPDDLKSVSLRFSFSRYNTKEDIDYTVSCLKRLAESEAKVKH